MERVNGYEPLDRGSTPLSIPTKKQRSIKMIQPITFKSKEGPIYRFSELASNEDF